MSAVQGEIHQSQERVGKRTSGLLPTTNGESISLRDVVQSFYSSVYGHHFSDQPHRYAKRYRLSTKEARKYLGSDASPAGHQVVLSERYIPLVVEQAGIPPVDDEDMTLLQFVAAFHDIGESTHPYLAEAGFTLVGDIPTGDKTDEDRENERLIRLHFWSLPPFNNLDKTFLERAETIIAHEPKEGDKALHELFELAHHIQAFDTAMTARYAVLHFPELRETPATLRSLRKLAKAVSIGEFAALACNPFGKQIAANARAIKRASFPGHSVERVNNVDVCKPATAGPQHIGHFGTRRCVLLQSK